MKAVAFFMGIIVLLSCSHKKEKQERADGGWKELESFHMIMADVYHPLKDSGNLTPAKKLMNQLADEAAKWSSAKLPEKVNTPGMKDQLNKLKTDARVLADEIAKGANDELIKDKLNQLHEQFHAIQKSWFSSKENEGEEEEDEDDDH